VCEGIVDVSAPPFNADPLGSKDSTAAIQAAVDWARAHYCAVFFPAGNYMVEETIVIHAVPRYMAQGHIPGPAAPGHKIGYCSRFHVVDLFGRLENHFLLKTHGQIERHRQ
jgi:hypothetical protein